MVHAARLISSSAHLAARPRRRSARFLSLQDAREFVRTCGVRFTSFKDFRRWSVAGLRPRNIPSNPDIVYANEGWKGYPDFLDYCPPMLSERTLRRVREAVERIPNTARDCMFRRSSALSCLQEKFQRHLPEFELRRLSARCPSIFLMRKIGEESANGSRSTDSWIALQVKFGSLHGKVVAARYKGKGDAFFEDVTRRDDVGVVFVSDGASHIKLKTRSEVNSVTRSGKPARVVLKLDSFDPGKVASIMNCWLQQLPQRSPEDWGDAFRHGCANHKRHDAAAGEISKRLYVPLGIHHEKLFPMDVSLHGNIRLGGVLCLQRNARPRGSHLGFFFDLTTSQARAMLRVGGASADLVQRFIAIIVDRERDASVAQQIRGVFIFPREYVFRNRTGDKDGTPKYRRTLLVYPPFVAPKNSSSQSRQQEQQKYYIDFDKMKEAEQLERSQALLGM